MKEEFAESVKKKILAKGLCERQARQLLRLSDKENMLALIDKISERNMTVIESEAAVDILIEGEAPRRLLSGEISERLTMFESFIDRSIESLSALGIKAEKRSESYNEKRYITIAISEK